MKKKGNDFAFGLALGVIAALTIGLSVGLVASHTDESQQAGQLSEDALHMLDECAEMHGLMHGEDGDHIDGMMAGGMMGGMMDRGDSFPEEKPDGWSDALWEMHKSHHPDVYGEE